MYFGIVFENKFDVFLMTAALFFLLKSKKSNAQMSFQTLIMEQNSRFRWETKLISWGETEYENSPNQLADIQISVK